MRLRGDSTIGEPEGRSGFRSKEFLRLSPRTLSSSLSLGQLVFGRREWTWGSPIIPLSRGEGSGGSLRRDAGPPECRLAVSSGGRGSRVLLSRLSRRAWGPFDDWSRV